jgi:hypothetical protein
MNYPLVSGDIGGFTVQHTDNKNEDGPVTEMAIVNTFTKLIFGDGGFTDRELLIISEFRALDAGVLRDSHQEMGEYLRNLGVREMIQMVSRLRQHMKASYDTAASDREQVALSVGIGGTGLNRGAH